MLQTLVGSTVLPLPPGHDEGPGPTRCDETEVDTPVGAPPVGSDVDTPHAVLYQNVVALPFSDIATVVRNFEEVCAFAATGCTVLLSPQM